MHGRDRSASIYGTRRACPRVAPQQASQHFGPGMADVETRQHNMADLLWRAADTSGDRTAVVEPRGVTTYAALRDRASAVAHALADYGVKPGDRVGVLIERGAEAAAAYFGALAAGATVIVINERLRP